MNLKTIILLMLLPMSLSAQQTITLEECWSNARKKMPVLQNLQALDQLDSLEQLILKTNYLPKLNANAQATWQSDVTSVEIPMPGFSIDEPSKEQYKATIEINQLIWDGGRTRALRQNKQIETALTKAETEDAFFSVKQRVTSLYFALILSQKQLELTQQLISTLDKKLNELDAAVTQGVVREAGKYVLQAEKLQAEQDLSGQKFQAKAVADMLNVLTGLNIQYSDSLVSPNARVPETVKRHQLTIYELQQDAAVSMADVLQKNRMPVFNAFAQAGYGKPGLNMLKNEADSWIMAGAGVSWNIFDWKKTNRQKQQLKVQRQMVDHSREQFLQQVNIEQQKYLAEMEQYRAALVKDEEIIELREKITRDYSSQLKQGTVTSSAYIEELFKEQAAKISQQIHEIKLNQAQVSLQILLEK